MKFKLVLLFLLSPIYLFSQNQLDGIYRGTLPKYWTYKNGKKVLWKDDERPKHFWYSLIDLKIKGDSIYWDDSPISMYKRDSIFSASDGGFHYYRGTLQKIDSSLKLTIEELFCDYCGIPHKKDSTGKLTLVIRKQTYTAKLVKEGFVINGYLFKKISDYYRLRSEDPAPDFWK